MATIRKLESGRHQAIIRRAGAAPRSKTFATYRDAKEWSTNEEGRIGRGELQTYKEAQQLTLAELASRFSIEFAPHHYKPRADGREAWKTQLKHVLKYFGRYPLSAIDPSAIASYCAARVKKVSGGTVRKEVFFLSKLLGFAEIECNIWLPHGNPVRRVRKPREPKARARRLLPDERTRLIEQCQRSRSPYLLPVVVLALETAMRQGEILGLRWTDLELDRQQAILHDTKNGDPRIVPLSSKAIDLLRGHQRKLHTPPAPTSLVFPVERLTIYHAFKAAARRADIDDLAFHDLRHEALSTLAELGELNVLELAAISGHKSLGMLKRYTHLHAGKLAERIDAARRAQATGLD